MLTIITDTKIIEIFATAWTRDGRTQIPKTMNLLFFSFDVSFTNLSVNSNGKLNYELRRIVEGRIKSIIKLLCQALPRG